MNNISDKLDIFLITFNRGASLDKTLNQLLSEDSPIKDIPITIIDNNSTDNTALIVKNYQSSHPNIIYTKNKHNIGGNANIAKAFYESSKEYTWVLADNDMYNWDNWSEVEKGMNEKADAIVVATYECPNHDIAQLFIQTSFVPGVIYKTSNIDDTAMLNMEFNISNMFPHLALSAKLINENKKFFILNKPIVEIGSNDDENGEYIPTRGYTGFIHPLQKNMDWITGYANSLHLIQDKKIRNYIIANNRFGTELNSAKLFFSEYMKSKKCLYNYLCVFAVLSGYDKLKFLLNAILYFTVYKIIFLFSTKSFDLKDKTLVTRYHIRLFEHKIIRMWKTKETIKGAC